MHEKIIIIPVTIALWAGLCGFGNVYNKATEKDSLILISTQKEKEIGRSISKQVKKHYKMTDKPLLAKRVEAIGERLAAVCDRTDVTFRFEVLKAEHEYDYNAFALPGGYIYIFDSLAEEQTSDDAVAAILAHEIGHVAARHSIQKLQGGLGMNALMLLAIGLGTDGRTVAETGDALNQKMSAYSREAELEADAISVKYLKKAGFDPHGIVDSLTFMRKLRKKGPILNYAYYRSHPYLSERIANARAEINGKIDFDSYINLPENEDVF